MLRKWWCSWHFIYLLILTKRFLTQLFQDILFNDVKSSLGEEKGCSFASGLCCSEKVQVHLRDIRCNCIELWKINFKQCHFFASCPQSEHPPQCVIKSDMCVYKGLSDEFCYFFSVEMHETVIIVRNSNRIFMHVIISMSSQNGMCHIWKLGQVYVQFLL